MRAKITTFSDPEKNRQLGIDLGLRGRKLDQFTYALHEVDFDVKVDADGDVEVIRVNKFPISKGKILG